MALQWYRWHPEIGRMEWQEAETRPGPDWECSDVPLFDSDLRPAWEALRGAMTVTWTEEPPVYLQEQDYPEFRLDQAVRKDLPAYEYRKNHPTEYRPAPALRLVEMAEEKSPAAKAAVEEGLAWLQRHYPKVLQQEEPPASLVPLAPSHQSPRVRAWWQQVHRRSSARRGRPALPARSVPRVAGRRREGGRR